MAIEITIPRLGWSMDEGTFSEWLKQDGDLVKEGDALFVIEGDKAAQEVESFDEGVLRLTESSPAVGDDVTVGQVIGYLCEPGEQPPSATTEANAQRNGADQLPSEKEIPQRAPTSSPGVATAVSASALTAATSVEALQTRQRVSPRAARLAAQLGVDLSRVVGSGKHGRIRERDVLACQHEAANQNISPSSPASAIRKTIAERMVAATREAAPVTLTSQVDATALAALRDELKRTNTSAPSYTAMLVRLAATALERHADATTQWINGGLHRPEGIHIAVAVDTPDGLLAPVIRDANEKTVKAIGSELKTMAAAARDRKLSAEQLEGGVFTISNLGSSRVDAFTPVLNLPQSMILGIGRIHDGPAVVDGALAVRKLMNFSLTFDHRVLDGAPAARLLDTLCELTEQPASALIG